jgi:hypothetical protein
MGEERVFSLKEGKMMDQYILDEQITYYRKMAGKQTFGDKD